MMRMDVRCGRLGWPDDSFKEFDGGVMPAESHPSGVLDNRSGGGSPGRIDGPLPVVGFCPFPCFRLGPVNCVLSHPAWAEKL